MTNPPGGQSYGYGPQQPYGPPWSGQPQPGPAPQGSGAFGQGADHSGPTFIAPPGPAVGGPHPPTAVFPAAGQPGGPPVGGPQWGGPQAGGPQWGGPAGGALPPAPPRQGPNVGLIIGVGAVVLLLVAVGVYAATRALTPVAVPTPTLAESTATSTRSTSTRTTATRTTATRTTSAATRTSATSRPTATVNGDTITSPEFTATVPTGWSAQSLFASNLLVLGDAQGSRLQYLVATGTTCEKGAEEVREGTQATGVERLPDSTWGGLPATNLRTTGATVPIRLTCTQRGNGLAVLLAQARADEARVFQDADTLIASWQWR